MSLSATLKPHFDSGDRARGRTYYAVGLVSEMRITNGLLTADVEGSYDSYEVVIDIENVGDEILECTCPRYREGYHCKHLWATILQYESTYGDGSTSDEKPRRRVTSQSKRPRSKPRSVPQWESVLQKISRTTSRGEVRGPSPFQVSASQQEEIHYVIDASEGSPYGPSEIQVAVFKRGRKTNGEWGQLKYLSLSHNSVNDLADPIDRQIAAQLMGADRSYGDQYGSRSARCSFSKFEIDPNWSRELCEQLIASGRLHWTLGMSLPLKEFYRVESIDFAKSAEIHVDILEQAKPKNSAVMAVSLQCDDAQLDDNEIVKVAENGVVLLRSGLIRIANPEAIDLWTNVKASPPITIAKKDRVKFLKQLADLKGLPSVKLPVTWEIKQPEVLEPQAVLKLHSSPYNHKELCGDVVFVYGDGEIALTTPRRTIFDDSNDCWSVRNVEAETGLVQQLTAFPIVDTSLIHYQQHDFRFNKKHLTRIVDELGSQGWTIQLRGKPIKQAGQFDISIESGLDWFDLSANVFFDGESIALPSLLQAIAKKEHFITLADGSSGRIPAEMLEKYARIAKFGQVEDDKIRFRPTQAMLLDAMLDSQEVKVDKGFKAFRRKLNSFKGVKPKSPPRGFKGELRSYQSEGLGWLHFLREFGLGGCLADDMGLGKTIQVLSLLESRRVRKVDSAAVKPKPTRKKKAKNQEQPPLLVAATATLKRKPSIVIVPKSLIFNWIEEAAKFTPRLRILNYTRTTRQQNVQDAFDAGGFDVLLTTYGTMRKDIADLSQIEFDYAILDESQAIKNSKAQCAKSSRLLRADYRLAMTGTPIENHLGELWSLFEFLNPGMLGGSSHFASLTNQKKSNEADREQTLAALSKAISPFLLRRTKEQVLTDLPAKTEQTLYCDMLPAQAKAYKQLKEYYRVKLAKRVETDGIENSKIQVLEALLRLRQVACDPRLLDKESKPGAKLELLGQQITDVISEGHKVLVFSQFTSFLSLVKQQFDDDGIKYEYLDGKSSNRAKSVKRFQEDESVSAFLISIKAGGHGLNLTAADYVYILDPWWNPAVEAQAIDRSHRMGQKNPVIAYRMICRDTVEEKIVTLQQGKRELADKIIRADESLIRSLTADDLMVLLG